ncbi:hypothetical protein FRC09_004132 [Ceratobasidium sp. 395]|nr:hypothetical protein FRC09_004132 [Ceratobasidium sp. 395]
MRKRGEDEHAMVPNDTKPKPSTPARFQDLPDASSPTDLTAVASAAAALPQTRHFTQNTFLLPTNRLSLADITFSAVLKGLLEYLLESTPRHGHSIPLSFALFETVVNHPAIEDIFGETKYVAPKKEKAPVLPLAAPKAPKKKKKPVEKDDDDESAVPAEPKAKNSLDDLPKSNFNLEG